MEINLPIYQYWGYIRSLWLLNFLSLSVQGTIFVKITANNYKLSHCFHLLNVPNIYI